MSEYLKCVVDEGIDASESIEKMFVATGDDSARQVMKFNDQNAVRGRRILQKLIDAENSKLEK